MGPPAKSRLNGWRFAGSPILADIRRGVYV